MYFFRHTATCWRIKTTDYERDITAGPVPFFNLFLLHFLGFAVEGKHVFNCNICNIGHSAARFCFSANTGFVVSETLTGFRVQLFGESVVPKDFSTVKQLFLDSPNVRLSGFDADCNCFLTRRGCSTIQVADLSIKNQ
jgi:hypothetical protein